MGDAVRLAFFSAFSILEIICLTFNVLVCAAILKTKSLKIAMNKLVFNLAVSDILIGLFILPKDILRAAFRHPTDATGDYFCKFMTGNAILWICSTASGFLLIAIAVERFCSVMNPNRSPRNIEEKISGTVACCWGAGFAANLPTLLVFSYDEKSDICYEKWPSWVSPKAYVVCIFLLGISSVIVMFVLYTRVIYILWRRQRRATEISQAARIRARKNITKTLVLVTFIHAVCRTPNYTIYLLSYYSPSVAYGSNVHKLTVLLILLNSAVHPFLLCWNVQGFRRPLFALFCRCHSNRVFSEPQPSQERMSTFNLRRTEVEKGVHRECAGI